MSLLVNAATLDEFNTILKDAAVCLMSRFLLDKVQDSYKNITGRVEKIGKTKIDVVVDDACKFNDTIPTDGTGESFVPASTNPFNVHFENLLNPIIKQIEVDSESPSDQYEENRSFCPEFFTFIRLHICEMALWSGVLLGSLNRYNKMEISKSQEEKLVSDEAFLSYKSANAKLQLQKQITLITDEPYQYDLRACALHHGADLYSGHYMSLIFEKDDVAEVDDTHIKCVTNKWENRSNSTVYLAFYGKNQNRSLFRQDIFSKHIKNDPANANNPKSKNAKTYRATSLKYATENTNSKVNNVSCQKED